MLLMLVSSVIIVIAESDYYFTRSKVEVYSE